MPRRRALGFTLLELLVVLALIGLASGLAAPRLLAWVDGARQRTAVDAVRQHLQQQPSQSFFSGQTVVLQPRPPSWGLPPGWHLSSPQPVVYEANGMTGGGLVLLHAQQQVLARWRVLPPAGEVVNAN